MIESITAHLVNCLEEALPPAVHGNIHDEPPPPLLTQEHIVTFLKVAEQAKLKEAWFMDFLGSRNQFSRRDKFRTTAGWHHLTDSVMIRGIYSNFDTTGHPGTAAFYERSYIEAWQKAQKISLALAANRRIPGIDTNIMLVRNAVSPIRYGELMLFTIDVAAELLTMEE